MASSLSAVQSAVWKITPNQITPKGLAEFLSPSASIAFRSAAPAVKASVGRLSWAFLYPAWLAFTSSPVLRVLLRIGIELAIIVFAPPLYPFIRVVLDLIKSLVSSRRTGDRSGGLGNSLANLLQRMEDFRQDPNAIRYIEAVERLLMDPEGLTSEPARIGATQGQPGEIE